MIQQRFWHPLFFLCLSLSNTHILGMTHARFLIHTPTTYTITHTDNASPLSSEQQTLYQEHLQVDSLSLSLSMTHTYLLHLSSFSPRFLHCQSVPKLCDPGDLSACTLTPPVWPSTPHPPPDRLRDGSARWFRLRKK